MINVIIHIKPKNTSKFKLISKCFIKHLMGRLVSIHLILDILIKVKHDESVLESYVFYLGTETDFMQTCSRRTCNFNL